MKLQLSEFFSGKNGSTEKNGAPSAASKGTNPSTSRELKNNSTKQSTLLASPSHIEVVKVASGATTPNMGETQSPGRVIQTSKTNLNIQTTVEVIEQQKGEEQRSWASMITEIKRCEDDET
ncbi:uncharacterized protein LOC132605826 [Lycium barbarum]|uniref:uncharacterized protein LOC132604970 n=1 Tax=Lycium barbarum TaxID=112863 RepID=UPI00293EBBC3|nr:uncharacterized protein LOC132604970 [Lycium barbarum]XP_060175059.1 uncharacterized protein LOC132605826 [Lycium barbarum]